MYGIWTQGCTAVKDEDMPMFAVQLKFNNLKSFHYSLLRRKTGQNLASRFCRKFHHKNFHLKKHCHDQYLQSFNYDKNYRQTLKSNIATSTAATTVIIYTTASILIIYFINNNYNSSSDNE